MAEQRRRKQITVIFSRFFGLFLLVSLFALAEFAPETIADQTHPLVGVWTGPSSNSAVPTTLYLEDDNSFTWLRGEKRLMSGDYEADSQKVNLKFGDAPEETMVYEYKLIAPDKISLKQGSFEYVLRKTQPHH